MINNSNENYLMDDANSPELDKKLVGRITEDFLKVSDNLKEASYQIKSRDFSKFPVFVVCDKDVPVGQTLFYRGDLENNYEYKASFIEEFLSRELVAKESEEFFKEHYKNPEEFCCLFVMDRDFAGFMYVPYPED